MQALHDRQDAAITLSTGFVGVLTRKHGSMDKDE